MRLFETVEVETILKVIHQRVIGVPTRSHSYSSHRGSAKKRSFGDSSLIPIYSRFSVSTFWEIPDLDCVSYLLGWRTGIFTITSEAILPESID
jgi:hypothetical protein